MRDAMHNEGDGLQNLISSRFRLQNLTPVARDGRMDFERKKKKVEKKKKKKKSHAGYQTQGPMEIAVF